MEKQTHRKTLTKQAYARIYIYNMYMYITIIMRIFLKSVLLLKYINI